MEDIFNTTCEPCKAGALRLNNEEIEELLRQVPGWSVIKVDGIQRLQKVYSFKNFKQAIEFTNKIGDAAERQGHHPVLVTEWGKVSVTWWTHKINGLHKNDFVMAAKSNSLY